jgi:hypothetical protein
MKNRAMHTHRRVEEFAWAQKRLGIDVARFGDDRTVIFPRQGIAAFRPIVMRHARNSAVSVEIANEVLAAKAKSSSELELVDASGGWSLGFVDVMRTNGYPPVEIQFGVSPLAGSGKADTKTLAISGSAQAVASLMLVSWNRIASWLRRIDDLRQGA